MQTHSELRLRTLTDSQTSPVADALSSRSSCHACLLAQTFLVFLYPGRERGARFFQVWDQFLSVIHVHWLAEWPKPRVQGRNFEHVL